MPVFKRQDIASLTQKIAAGEIAPVYLLIGERFLCREAAGAIENALLPQEKERQAQLNSIDGERENTLQTLAKLKTYNLFGGRQVIKVTDSRLLYSKAVARDLWIKAEKVAQENPSEALIHLRAMLGLAGLGPDAWQTDNLSEASSSQWTKLFGFGKPTQTAWAETILTTPPPSSPEQAQEPPPGDAGKAYMAAIAAGLPPNNILLLLTETVDKRKKLYKFLEKQAVIIDLQVAGGNSSATAHKDQATLLKELVNQTLAKFGKRLRPEALNLLLTRIGFHPAAAVMEAEKLALYVGEADIIGQGEVDEMVGRTKEEAIYELSEAYSDGNLIKGLTILGRLRQDGMHPLAMLGGLRNHVRKLLLARAIQDQADRLCDQRVSFPVFQKSYLPAVRESWKQQMRQTRQEQQEQMAPPSQSQNQGPQGPSQELRKQNKGGLAGQIATSAKPQNALAAAESSPQWAKQTGGEDEDRAEGEGKAASKDPYWPSLLPDHPYALYKLFLQAAKLSPSELREMLRALLQAEYRLKNSSLSETAILSALLFSTCRQISQARLGFWEGVHT